MLEWLKNLEPEFMILFGTALVTIILLIITVIRSARIHALIGKRALDLTEDLLVRDDEEIVEIVMSNTSYIDIQTRTVGILYKKSLLPIKEEDITIFARDSYRLSITLKALRQFVLGDQKKIKKIYVYAEDSLARRTIKRAKNSFRRLKRILKVELKAEKLAAKKVRFETGKYNFGERVGLIFKAIFSPLTNLFRIIRQGINRSLKNREIKLELKKAIRKQKRDLIRESDERRHEQMRAENEERLKEERLAAELKLQEDEKQRKEEIELERERKKAEEIRHKNEAEARRVEAEQRRLEEIEFQKNEEERLKKEAEELRLTEQKLEKERIKAEEKRLKKEAEERRIEEEKKQLEEQMIEEQQKELAEIELVNDDEAIASQDGEIEDESTEDI